MRRGRSIQRDGTFGNAIFVDRKNGASAFGITAAAWVDGLPMCCMSLGRGGYDIPYTGSVKSWAQQEAQHAAKAVAVGRTQHAKDVEARRDVDAAGDAERLEALVAVVAAEPRVVAAAEGQRGLEHV